MNFFTRKVPIYFVVISSIVGALISYSFIVFVQYKGETTPIESVAKSTGEVSCGVHFSRLSGRKFIKPLLFAERDCEADRLMVIKNSVVNLIDNLKANGDVNSVSVYLRLFGKGEWMSVNNDIKYKPGSLFKVPLFITYLRMAEQNPEILNKKITFNQISQESKGLKQEFLKDRIKLGNSYTIKELFNYMIIHSDNNATLLLMNSIPFAEFTRTFTDFGLSQEVVKSDAVISAQDYSLFWLALYNGSYLNFDNSDYALSLLSQCDFTEGLVKGVPDGTRIAHKFGEKGDLVNHAFHETGIVYINSNPYLLTVMTEGKDQTKLPKVLQQISSVVYNNIEGLTH